MLLLWSNNPRFQLRLALLLCALLPSLVATAIGMQPHITAASAIAPAAFRFFHAGASRLLMALHHLQVPTT